MGRLFCILTAITILVFTLVISGFSQTDMKKIENPAFEEKQRPPAVFVHDEHNELAGVQDCSVCHHVYEDGELLEGAMSVGMGCNDCHSLEPDQDNSVGLMDAYHGQCLGCHRDEGAGPLACGECHVR